MKRSLYQCFYKILSFLSKYIDNRYLTRYKLLLGTSLLVLMNVTQGCKRTPQVTCYEPSVPWDDDTIEIQKMQPVESTEVVCYVSTIVEPESDVYDQVEEMPEFPGGMNALLTYISESIQYPLVSIEKGSQGQVLVTFVIDKDGTVTNAIVTRGPYTSLNEEALRVVNGMPQWRPGRNEGKNVKVRFTIPIQFRLPQ